MTSFKKCYFNSKALEATVGNKKTGYEVLECLKVPSFKRLRKERESLGNGWYGEEVTVEVNYDRCFIIIKNKKPFGILIDPYCDNIKSDILPIDHNIKSLKFKEIEDFIREII